MLYTGSVSYEKTNIRSAEKSDDIFACITGGVTVALLYIITGTR